MYLMQKQNAYVAHLIVTVVQYANGYCTLYLMVYVTAALIWYGLIFSLHYWLKEIL